MRTLSINFYAEKITDEKKQELMTAVEHEKCAMLIQMAEADISRLNTQIANLEKNEDMSEDKKKVKLDDLNQKLEDVKQEKSDLEASKEETLEIYNKVFASLTYKNKDHFGNNKDVVRTVLRVLASWDNSKLVKYAIIPAFQSPELYNALEAIHINSNAGENGNITMSNEVKEAYKKASTELETIIKTTFSLPFETPYTAKTRVKLTAEDKKLLNDCYVKGFTNKFDIDDKKDIISFKERQINTLVKAKKNRKTSKIEYDYSGLASTISNIVIKHYFVEK